MLHSVVIKKCCHQTDIRNDKSKKTSNQYRSKIAGKQYEGQWLSSSDNICNQHHQKYTGHGKCHRLSEDLSIFCAGITSYKEKIDHSWKQIFDLKHSATVWTPLP